MNARGDSMFHPNWEWIFIRWPYQRLGFHVAVYYSYATNKTDILTYSEDGRNSMGVRVGVCF